MKTKAKKTNFCYAQSLLEEIKVSQRKEKCPWFYFFLCCEAQATVKISTESSL